MDLLEWPEYNFLKTDLHLQFRFYDLLNGLEKRLDYAKEHTSLPETPNLPGLRRSKWRSTKG